MPNAWSGLLIQRSTAALFDSSPWLATATSALAATAAPGCCEGCTPWILRAAGGAVGDPVPRVLRGLARSTSHLR